MANLLCTNVQSFIPIKTSERWMTDSLVFLRILYEFDKPLKVFLRLLYDFNKPAEAFCYS